MRQRVVLAFTAIGFCGLLLALQLNSSARSRAPETVVAFVQFSDDVVSWSPTIDYRTLTLVVVGSRGTVYEREHFAGEPVYFPAYDSEGNPLVDGSYTWELRFEPVDGHQQAAAPPSAHGYFQVQAGVVLGPGESPDMFDTVSPVDDQILRGRTCIGSTCADGESFPSGDGLLKLKGSSSLLLFEDISNPAGFTSDWKIEANDGAELLDIEDVDGGTTPVTIEAGARDKALYLSSSARVGMGTAAPQKDLHIISGTPGVGPTARLEQNSELRFDLSVTNSGFQIDDAGTGGNPRIFRIDDGSPSDSLIIQSDGDVGSGTSNPTAALHLRRDGSAKVLVEEISGPATVRTLFELLNVGGSAFRMTNSVNGDNWFFAQNNAGGFLFSRGGTGGPELKITAAGRVIMGPGGALNFDLRPSGDLHIAGNVIANGTVYPSDRALKEQIVPLDAVETLRKVVELPISEWSYKERSERHVGPMAQEFWDAFQIGKDDKHLNPGDTAGIALAAIQGLYQLLGEKDQQLEQLRRQKDARISALEARVARLEGLEAELAQIRSLLATGR